MFRHTKLAIACSVGLSLTSLLSPAEALAAVPTISNSSSASSTLTINGTNLSGGPATVVLGSFAPLTVTTQTATQLVATLPVGIAPGNYALSVQVGTKGNNSTTSVVTIATANPGGPTGPTGATGAVGPTGLQGAKGDTGAQGATGAVGPQGAQGFAGPAGAAGATGAQGPKGDMGASGPQGTTGASGVTGAQGPAGPQGPSGVSLSLVDANGTVVGPVVGQGNVLAHINGNIVPLSYSFGNLDGQRTPLGPELDIGGNSGPVYFSSPDCTGSKYIDTNKWTAGATRPAVVASLGAHQIAIYTAGTAALFLNYQSYTVDLSPSAFFCNVVSGNNYVYPIFSPPIIPTWTYPFSLQ